MSVISESSFVPQPFRRSPKVRVRWRGRKGVVACCLYSSYVDADGGASYPPEDLPDSLMVVVDGPDQAELAGSYSHVAGTYHFQKDGSDREIRLYSKWSGLPEDQWWAFFGPFGHDDSFGPAPDQNNSLTCLIGLAEILYGDEDTQFSAIHVKDEFLDTYTIDGVITVTRASLCNWVQDPDDVMEGEIAFRLFYSADQPPEIKPKWFMDTVDGTIYIKDDPQDSPVGTYTEEGGAATRTVT